MKSRVFFLIGYYLFWVFTFWIFKALFLFYHKSIYSSFSGFEIFRVFLYGSLLDFSFASYLSLLPVLLIALSNFGAENFSKKILFFYTCFALFLISLISIVDLEIFKWWGFRIDSTLFKYLSNPNEAAASASVSPVFLLSCSFILLCALLTFLYWKFLYKRFVFTKKILPKSIIGFLTTLLFIPLLIVGIRGGFQLSPINQSSVCFSNNTLLNQAAINSPWNFCYSILESSHSDHNPFIHLSEKEAEERIKKLYPEESKANKVIKDGKINVILIIWESFTGKAVESLGGRKGITPGFDKLTQEGILFNKMYASGDRSDKGLISILSAFPAQPTTSIMTKTTKAAKLPSLADEYKANGYHTSFYYGGEPEFANIKSYLLNSGYNKIIAKENFPAESWNSKWGAHDEVVFEKLLEDLRKADKKFFSTLFTLSSHEPFDIPSQPLLKETDEESLFLNSIHYTDSCLYDFIEKSKKEAWWDNTLIIVTADHGHRLPGSVANHYPDEFKIPMLWLGGALLKKDTTISKIGNQTDLAKTLLNQMDLNAQNFTFSKDLLSKSSLPFSYYAFNNGFGFISEQGAFVFDNVSKGFVLKDSAISEQTILNGKAYLQSSFQEYLNK